ncbi:MAG TPA: SMP-30/gluconolactonase/LRE family protein [Rhizobiaceae bacterium]|nr:SMP-30/gluconolactonase/LRE family protein [Rhizobiaceae bacterium]
MSEIAVSVLSDVDCYLGEGPIYDAASGKLFWFNIARKKLLEMLLPDGATIVHDLPLIASALAIIDEERQLLATETGLQVRDVATGKLTMLVPIEADNAATRSNDARVHPCGAFWVGTMGKNAEHGAGSIYWFFRGEVRKLFGDITIPNSICFSPDGRIAYFGDTRKNVIRRVPCDPTTGLPTGEASVFVDAMGMEGGIDGSVTDADGVLWNARWGGAALDAWSPDGRLLRTIPLPARQPSCPAFVGKDAGRIAVTSAWEGLDEVQRKADPQAGYTFLVDIPVRGRFDPQVLI